MVERNSPEYTITTSALAAVGIAAPFALEAALRRPDARACACIGVLVLIGGFFLRYCLCTAPFMDIASYL